MSAPRAASSSVADITGGELRRKRVEQPVVLIRQYRITA